MVSRVKQARQLLAGLSARDVAVVGGVAGAIGIGAYAVYIYTGQATVDTYTKEYNIIAQDYMSELVMFVKQNGTGGLTQTQMDALTAKLNLMKKISDAATAAAAQGQLSLQKFF